MPHANQQEHHPHIAPELSSNEYKDLFDRYKDLHNQVQTINIQRNMPRSRARIAVTVGAAVVGVGIVSIMSNKLWGWAFPQVPDNRRVARAA